MKRAKLALLLAVLASQVMLVMSIHNRDKLTDQEPEWWKHDARKEYRQESTTTKNYQVVTYFELFSAKDAMSNCGFISVERWTPKLGPDMPEQYLAIRYSGDNTEARHFDTLEAAEEWLFSSGCPSYSWRTIGREGR